MPRSGFQIQTILKAYHKSFRWIRTKAGDRGERSNDRNRVEISVEGRKKKICQKAANCVIEKLTRAEDTRVTLPKESQ